MRPNLPGPADFDRIAALCDRRWDCHYTRCKLRTDPVYAAVAGELAGTDLPVLDIGCGLGLLGHYLHASGLNMPVTGFDYDERKIRAATVMATRAGRSGLHFRSGDARTGLPEFAGHVVILDILQFFQREEQELLLAAAAARVAPGGRLVIRSGLRAPGWRYRVTVLADYLARATLWMKAAPVCYPDADQFRRVLGGAGLEVAIRPLWGSTPFHNHLIVGRRP
jgi:2-polyprenyl-3-methyl-5-hydroxy-6-metoxy-1,4-benzoquinol methylase